MSSISIPRQASNTGFVVLLYSFAVFSGVAALIYEVAWAKMLALTFGRSTLAVTAVVGGFMVGMGIGAWLYHRAHATRFDAVKLYAALEFGIALVTALLTPVFVALPEFFASAAGFLPAGLILDLSRTAFVVAILIVPAALMGATFPALCTILIRSREGVSRHLGPIYGLNTIGAAMGALIAGFVLMEWLGLRGSVRVANGINLAIGLLAWLLASRTSGRPSDDVADLDDTEAALPTRLPARVTGIVLFFSGFATLAYEIVWFRALRYLFGVSSYALTVTLVVFLVGLGAGGVLANRVRERHGPEKVLANTQFGIAYLAMMAIGAEYLLLTSPELLARISVFSIGASELAWQSRMLLAVLIAMAMMLPATLLMGLSFPIATRLFLGDVRQLSRRVGTAYFLANLGSVIGAVAAAFFLLPVFGTIRGTLAIAAGNILIGLLIRTRLSKEDRPGAILIAVPTMTLLAMLAGFPAHLPFATLQKNLPMRLLWSEEGDVATAQVWALNDSPQLRAIFVDGTAIGESFGLRKSIWGKQRLLAHLPMALEPATRTALNIGFGSGSTSQALATYPGIERIDVVEISASVVRGSRLFFSESVVLDDPRVNVYVEDVAHFLLRGDSEYELIISDGKLAEGFSGNELMLCRDFYEQAKRRLTTGGLFVQWIPLAYPTETFEIILRTFLASFPETQLFMDPSTGFYLVGSEFTLGMTRAERLATGVAIADLAVLDIPNTAALMSRWLVDGRSLRRVVGEGRINTWDHSATEFAINRSNAQSLNAAAAPNLALLLGARAGGAVNPYLPPDSAFAESSDLVALATLALYNKDLNEAIRLAESAMKVNPMDPAPKNLLKGLRQSANGRPPPMP